VGTERREIVTSPGSKVTRFAGQRLKIFTSIWEASVPELIKCNTCGREVNVDSGGYLTNHRLNPSMPARCDGSGRHRSFVKEK
jgi:hypothetical protein